MNGQNDNKNNNYYVRAKYNGENMIINSCKAMYNNGCEI